MIARPRSKSNRSGGVYVAVLGTALIIALLGMASLIAQRIQNKIVVASTDIRQAELNANTAIELALLSIKQESNWRTAHANGDWFTNRGTAAGTCSANVTDPVDGILSNSTTDPVTIYGIGYSGNAVQRVKLTVDSFKEPVSSLRSAVAAGDLIDLSSDTLRTNGLITANETAASSSQVYGSVEAVTISGSTYNSSTTQITSSRRPTMPNWSSVFSYYRTNGTQINYSSLPTTTSSNFVKNGTITSTNDWTGTPPDLPTADVTTTNNWSRSASFSLRVRNRTAWNAGAAQRIEHFVKPGQQYDVSASANAPGLVGIRSFRMWIFVKGTGDGAALSVNTNSATCVSALNLFSCLVSGRLTVPTWSGDLEYAYIKVSDATSSGSTAEFYMDDVEMTEVTSGRYIYKQVLSPSINPFGGSLNTEGIYWIDCNGSRLNIERSRILGTLLVVNPGAGSCIDHGPINWAPAVAGYPALLVDADTAANADFTIKCTNRALSEIEQDVNYHSTGAAVSEFDSSKAGDKNDIYPSEIRGLIAIEDDLIFQNRPFIKGQIIVGDDISNSSGTLELDFKPESLLSPPPGFLAPNSFDRRPASAYKAVTP